MEDAAIAEPWVKQTIDDLNNTEHTFDDDEDEDMTEKSPESLAEMKEKLNNEDCAVFEREVLHAVKKEVEECDKTEDAITPGWQSMNDDNDESEVDYIVAKVNTNLCFKATFEHDAVNSKRFESKYNILKNRAESGLQTGHDIESSSGHDNGGGGADDEGGDDGSGDDSDGDNGNGGGSGDNRSGGDNIAGDFSGGQNGGGDIGGEDNGGGDNGSGDNGSGDNGGGDRSGGDNRASDDGSGHNGGGDNGSGDDGGGDDGGGDRSGGDNRASDDGSGHNGGENGSGDDGSGDDGGGDDGGGDNRSTRDNGDGGDHVGSISSGDGSSGGWGGQWVWLQLVLGWLWWLGFQWKWSDNSSNRESGNDNHSNGTERNGNATNIHQATSGSGGTTNPSASTSTRDIPTSKPTRKKHSVLPQQASDAKVFVRQKSDPDSTSSGTFDYPPYTTVKISEDLGRRRRKRHRKKKKRKRRSHSRRFHSYSYPPVREDYESQFVLEGSCEKPLDENLVVLTTVPLISTTVPSETELVTPQFESHALKQHERRVVGSLHSSVIGRRHLKLTNGTACQTHNLTVVSTSPVCQNQLPVQCSQMNRVPDPVQGPQVSLPDSSSTPQQSSVERDGNNVSRTVV